MEGHHPGQEPVQDKERKASSVFQTEPAKTGLVGPVPFPPRIPLSSPPQSSGTFQRLFMRYFLSKIWDLRRRLQRLAFSARLLSQGWARHWAALIRALWRGGGMVRGGGRPGSRPPSPVPTRHNTCTGLCTHGVHVLGGEPHRWSLTMRLETKSLASSDTASKVSSSKYQLLDRTLFRVSVSSSPRKGERPLRLEGGDGRRQGGKIGSGMQQILRSSTVS